MKTELLEILVCPLTKTKLYYDRERQWLVSTAAKLAYPIRDDIPILLEEEAIPLDEEQVEHYRKLKDSA